MAAFVAAEGSCQLHKSHLSPADHTEVLSVPGAWDGARSEIELGMLMYVMIALKVKDVVSGPLALSLSIAWKGSAEEGIRLR